MKNPLLIYPVLLLISLIPVYSQQPGFSSNPDLSFKKFISGVKYAEIGLNAFTQEQVDKKEGIAPLYYTAQKYLQSIGFDYVALTSAEKTDLEISVRSYCEYTQVVFSGDIKKNSITGMTITFISCNGDIFSFTSDKVFNYRKFSDVEKN